MDAAIKNLFGLKPVDDRDIAVRFDLTTKGLGELGARMATVPGRKNLVWITHGIPIDGYSFSKQAHVDFTNLLRQYYEALRQTQIVVYTVEQSMGGAAAAVGTRNAQTLEEASGNTGGRAYASDRAGAAIQQARTDSRANYEIAYYSTPYSASLNPDGKHHKIRIVCERKEVRLQTEHGFYAMALDSFAPGALRSRELPEEVESAVHSPFDATEIGLRASVLPDPGNPRNMRFEIHIDAADLLRNPARDAGTAKVSVAFAAFDEALRQPSPPMLVSLTPEQPATATHGEIGLRQAVPAADGTRKVRVIAFDEELGAVGSLTIPTQH